MRTELLTTSAMSVVRSFRKDRRGVSALVFGLAAVPIAGMVALGIDFSAAIRAKTLLDSAADAAVLTAATSATQLYQKNPLTTDYSPAQIAATTRFKAQAGNLGGYVSTPIVNISVTEANLVFTSTVQYQANFTLPIGWGNVLTWPLTSTVASKISLSNPYLNVTMMLDNSGSMEIGANPSDIATLMPLTACSQAGAYYPVSNGHGGVNWVDSGSAPAPYTTTPAGQTYSGNYSCNGTSNHYSLANPACPISGYYVPTNGQLGPDCTNLPKVPVNNTSMYPTAGAPCAFACHFDTSGKAGTTKDHFGVARSTIGKNNQVTLRFDLIKSAVNTLLTTMSNNNQQNTLQTNIFTFTDQLTQVYPSSGFGNSWSTAISDVGAPPTVANGPETGIQPYLGKNGGDTDFTATMSALATKLPVCNTTTPCDGLTANTPFRTLFIVTDGLNDPSSRTQGGIDVAQCTKFKNNGYQVYVLYTPYYPLMNPYYLNTDYSVVEGTGPGTIAYNAQQCASAPENYIEATDGPSITSALNTFFTSALKKAAHLTH